MPYLITVYSESCIDLQVHHILNKFTLITTNSTNSQHFNYCIIISHTCGTERETAVA